MINAQMVGVIVINHLDHKAIIDLEGDLSEFKEYIFLGHRILALEK